MNGPNLRNIDLNLLVSADVLLREASIGRAATELGITQPAASQRLARLREMFDDALLVRRGGRMVRTPVADHLRGPIERALAEVRSVLERRPIFDPRSDHRVFVVAMTDFVAIVLLPELMPHVLRTAPGVTFDLRAVDASRYEQDLERVHDVAISVLPERAGVHRLELFREAFACLVRAGHPLLEGRRTPDRFAAFPHIVMSPPGSGKSPIEAALEQQGVERRVVLRAPAFGMAPAVLSATDAVMTLPSRLARHYAPRYGLESFPSPLAPKLEFAVHAAWSARSDGDPARRWLVEQLVAVSGARAAKKSSDT